jgi:TM2 domain-containing membrane protein YozV
MKGQVLEFSIQTNSGIISGDDGNRYTFTGADWKETRPPSAGTYVDFATAEGSSSASGIYLVRGAAGTSSLGGDAPNKIGAGLLAIFLGALGVHKFYLGYKNEGIILLALTGSGILFSFLLVGLLWVWIPGLIALIEGIIYLTKTDEEFERVYVVGRRPWF